MLSGRTAQAPPPPVIHTPVPTLEDCLAGGCSDTMYHKEEWREGKRSYMSDRYPCWYPVQIRFRDLDPLAHVNNTIYFTYFEESRSFYFNHLETWLNEWPSREEHQEVEGIVSHPPHN